MSYLSNEIAFPPCVGLFSSNNNGLKPQDSPLVLQIAFFCFFSLSPPFLLHPLPLPTPSMLAMLLFSAQCSVGMSIKASRGRKDHQRCGSFATAKPLNQLSDTSRGLYRVTVPAIRQMWSLYTASHFTTVLTKFPPLIFLPYFYLFMNYCPLISCYTVLLLGYMLNVLNFALKS